MSDGDKLAAKDWRSLLIGAAISAFLSAPSWLPVLGIEYGWFGSRLMAFFQGVLPILMLVAGFLIGWSSHRRKMAKDGAAAERAQITADLTCCDLPGLLLIARLYCDGFTMAKGNLAEANDPVWLAGIVTTGRVEVDGMVSYKLDIAPERRSLYARHERFFLEEVKRIGKGRLDVDFDGARVKLHPSAGEQ